MTIFEPLNGSEKSVFDVIHNLRHRDTLMYITYTCRGIFCTIFLLRRQPILKRSQNAEKKRKIMAINMQRIYVDIFSRMLLYAHYFVRRISSNWNNVKSMVIYAFWYWISITITGNSEKSNKLIIGNSKILQILIREFEKLMIREAQRSRSNGIITRSSKGPIILEERYLSHLERYFCAYWTINRR